MVSSARKLSAGGAWLLIGQIGGLLAQFVYAAVTARLMKPGDFAIYAIAIIIANLIAIFSVAGLGQSVARLEVMDTRLLRSLSTISFGVGLVAMAIVVLPSPIWAVVWNNANAASAIALAGVTAFFAPAVGVLSGYMRRVARFRTLSLIQLFSTLMSFSASLVMVAIWRSPLALVASAVMLQVFSWGGLAIATRSTMLPGRIYWPESVPHLAFSWRVTAANIMSFALENVPRLLVSRYGGATQLGLWNRADVVATIPFDRMNIAISQVLYPEYRHDISNTDRISRRWPDMLAFTAWISVPTSALVAGGAPALVPFLLGSSWSAAIPFVTVLALASAGRGVSVQLASALEAVARFRWIWISQSILLALLVPIVIFMIVIGNVWVAIGFAFFFPIARHAIQLIFCFHHRLFTPLAIVRAYWQPLLAGIVMFFGARAVTLGTENWGSAVQVGAVTVFSVCVAFGAWSLRGRLAAWALVTKYFLSK